MEDVIRLGTWKCLKCEAMFKLRERDRPGMCPVCFATSFDDEGYERRAFYKVNTRVKKSNVYDPTRRCPHWRVCELYEVGRIECNRDKGMFEHNGKMLKLTCKARNDAIKRDGKDYIGLTNTR